MKQMAQVHAKNGGSLDRRAERRARGDRRPTASSTAERMSARARRSMTSIVEKPKPEDAPSTLAVVGRYILSPRIFHFLENLRPGAGREIQLTDAIGRLLREETRASPTSSRARRYDCGSKLGYLRGHGRLRAQAPRGRRRVPRVPRGHGGRRPGQAIVNRGEAQAPARARRAAVPRRAGATRPWRAWPREITARLRDEFPVVLSVMGGAVVFTGQLLPLLALPAGIRRDRGHALRQRHPGARDHLAPRAARQRARAHRARDRRHPRRGHHARGDARQAARDGRAPRAERRVRRQGHRARQARRARISSA